MKSIVQNLRTGKLKVADIPTSGASPGCVLVQNVVSLVSAGTERTLVTFGEKKLIGKALARPDLVWQVFDKAKREGLIAAVDTVRSRLDQPLAMGYSCSGTVLALGENITGIQPGDRVACAGSGYAVHAEVVKVPENLAVKLPDEVDYESGAFVALGTIALHGLRLAQLELGESVAIIGLGLVGNIAAQLAKSAGCRVVGLDPNPVRCRLAKRLGCDIAVTSEPQLSDQISQVVLAIYKGICATFLGQQHRLAANRRASFRNAGQPDQSVTCPPPKFCLNQNIRNDVCIRVLEIPGKYIT